MVFQGQLQASQAFAQTHEAESARKQIEINRLQTELTASQSVARGYLAERNSYQAECTRITAEYHRVNGLLVASQAEHSRLLMNVIAVSFASIGK